MIKKFNEYNTIEKELEFSEGEVASLKTQVEETLIDMIDNGFNIHTSVLDSIYPRDTVSISIKSHTSFKYPFESDIDQHHFIDLLHSLDDEYNIFLIMFFGSKGYETIKLSDLLDKKALNYHKTETKYYNVIIQIRKNILRHMRTIEKKYIKTFESNEETIIDQAYIEECFIDLPCNTYLLTSDICIVDIDINPLSGYQSVYDFIDEYKSTLDMLNDVEANMQKVKMKYKNIKHKISFFTDFTDDDKLRVALFLNNDDAAFDLK